jgi:branched-chain amino acid transport system ATP-binding protein
MAERMIEAKGVSAGYGSLPVLVDLDLHVEEGEMVALLGSNGAGKTTTLMALAGALTGVKGEITVCGRPAPRGIAKRIRGGIGFLPERRAVFNALTVAENLRLCHGTVEEALEHFPELEKRLGVRAGLVSGGEQQMLALARTLSSRPRVLLADEISLGLAPLVVRRLLEALAAAAAKGVAVLMVEQHPHTALRWTDSAYVMRQGRLALEGSSAELTERIDDVAKLYL